MNTVSSRNASFLFTLHYLCALMKILVIRFSSIGDIVLASPVFRCLKNQLAHVEIHFLTKRQFKAVTASNPYIDRFWYFEDDLDDMIRQLQAENFEAVVDLHKNFRSIRIKKALHCKRTYTIKKLNVQKMLLTKFKVNVMPGVHITTRSLNTIAPLGVKDDGGGLDYFIPDDEIISDDDLPFGHIAGFIALVIGANHVTKRLPPHKLIELCNALNYPLVIVGGPEEQDTGEALASLDPVRIFNACGKFNLNESADIIRRSKLVISHDTGFQYIACAFQKPVLAIWGGTSPKLDVEPYYGSNFMSRQRTPIYENICLNLWCQPCSKYGLSKCPLGHFNCMEKQDISWISKKSFALMDPKAFLP